MSAIYTNKEGVELIELKQPYRKPLSPLRLVSIIIPVYNEEATVETLLNKVYDQSLPGNLHKELIIVESNSSDSTRARIQNFMEQKKTELTKIRLFCEEKAKGKGHAVRLALQHVSGEIILIQDGDLEYDTADYPNLLQPLLDGHADFVLGSRHLSAGSWKIRKFQESPAKAAYMNFGGAIFHAAFNLLYRVRLTDPTTMYKLFLTKCLEGVPLESNRFDFDFELVAKLIRLGYVPYEIPISYRSRGFAGGKKVRIFRDPILWILAILKFRFKPIRRVPRSVPREDLFTAFTEWQVRSET